MTTQEITLVKNSWKIVSGLDPEMVGGLFYNRLFEINPSLKPMFSRSSIAEQSRKLVSMLTYVIIKLDKLDDIIDEVKKLARRHSAYGVQDSHYVAVGQALLSTLEKGLGEAWGIELAEAWTTAYTILSTAMITASHEAIATV